MNTKEIIAELQLALDSPRDAGRIIRDLIDRLSFPFATVAVYGPGNNDDLVPDEYLVRLSSVGPHRIWVIKTIREILGCGLKESKEMTDTNPDGFCGSIIKSGVGIREAQDIKLQLEKAGALVTLHIAR